MNKIDKKQKVVMITALLGGISILAGITYATINFTVISDQNLIKSGKVSMSYTESSRTINLTNALPTKDELGKNSTEYFDFTIMSNADTNADDSEGIKIPYSLIIEPKAVDSGLDSFTNDQIKVYLTKVEGSLETEVIPPTKISELTKIDTNFNLYNTENIHKNNNRTITTDYRLRAWVDYNVDVSTWKPTSKEKQYKFAVNVNTRDKNIVTYKLGDVNNSGSIDYGDLQAMHVFLNGTSSLDPTYVLHSGDVTGDGQVDDNDKNLLYEYLSGQVKTFPAGEPLDERTYEVEIK